MLFLILLSLILIPGFKTMHMSDISIVRMIGTPQAMCIALLFSVFFFECYDKPVVLCMLMLALAFVALSGKNMICVDNAQNPAYFRILPLI